MTMASLVYDSFTDDVMNGAINPRRLPVFRDDLMDPARGESLFQLRFKQVLILRVRGDVGATGQSELVAEQDVTVPVPFAGFNKYFPGF